MTDDLLPLENQLRALRPAALDGDFASRLARIASPSPTVSATGDLELENALRALKPVALPPEALASVIAATSGKAAAVVQFPVRRRWSRYAMSAAAAVAILGGLAALLVPAGDLRLPADSSAQVPKRAGGAPARVADASGFVPAGFNTSLSRTRDEGVVWQTPSDPRRVLRVSYLDRAVMKDGKGRTLEIKRPRDEYIIVPEKMD